MTAPDDPRPGARRLLRWVGAGMVLSGGAGAVVHLSGPDPAASHGSIALMGVGVLTILTNLGPR